MTLRRRLLLAILTTLVALVAAVGVAQVVVLHSYLLSRSTAHLQDLARLAAPPPAQRNGVAPPVVPLDQTVSHIANDGVAVEILGGDGSILAAQGFTGVDPSASFSVPTGTIPINAGSAPTVSEMSNVDGHHLLVLSEALTQPRDATVVIAVDLSNDDATIRTVLLVVVAGAAVALILAGVVMLPLLRGALAPLRHMATTADAIAAGDLKRRVGGGLSSDEIGRLGAAFDGMAERVQSLVGELRAREVTMRQFVEDASHELRTPVTAIRGSAQVLAGGGLADADVAEALHNITDETGRMAALVDDLLTLSRADSIDAATPTSTCDLYALCRENRVRWMALAPGREVNIVGEKAVVVCDSESLTRALDNLVTNAAKYSTAGESVDVAVRTWPDSAVIDVRDHGPGIHLSERERVFDRFYRGDSARSRTIGGTGLGLAIVRAIAHAQGGSVMIVDADPGPGTCVRLTFPRR